MTLKVTCSPNLACCSSVKKKKNLIIMLFILISFVFSDDTEEIRAQDIFNLKKNGHINDESRN